MIGNEPGRDVKYMLLGDLETERRMEESMAEGSEEKQPLSISIEDGADVGAAAFSILDEAMATEGPEGEMNPSPPSCMCCGVLRAACCSAWASP